MHLLRNSKPIPMGSHGVLEPGEWLCHDQNAAELMLMGERGTSAVKESGNWWNNSCRAESGGTLFVRSGAIGDLLYLSPVLNQWKTHNPDSRIALSCFPKHHEVVCDLGIELLPYPLPAEYEKDFYSVISLENIIETNHTDHATDCFARYLNSVVDDYRPIFKLSEFETAMNFRPKVQRTRVGIQPLASVSNRCYPLALWGGVIQMLTEKHDCEVFLFGHHKQIPPITTPNCTNLTEEKLSFRQSAAILSSCDLFVGVDSCFLPLCHALDIPAVGLYAAFDWKTRTSKAPMTWALTGLGPCAPCNWLKHAGKDFPPDQDCAKTRFCGPLASITPERIVSKLMTLPRGKA